MNLKVDLDFKCVLLSLQGYAVCLPNLLPYSSMSLWLVQKQIRAPGASGQQAKVKIQCECKHIWMTVFLTWIQIIFDCSVQFSKFCHNSAIRCTELFEYCQRLGNAEFIIPAFQVQFTHYPFYIFDILDDSLLHSTGWLKVQRSNTALVNVKIIVMANQIKERGAYSSQKAQNIHWP